MFISTDIKNHPHSITIHLSGYMIFVGSNLFERGDNISLCGYFLPLRANEFAPTLLTKRHEASPLIHNNIF